MQISMHNWMRAEPLEVTVARPARYGYDAIEISGEPARYHPREVDFHVADNNRKPPGEGALDGSRLIGTLREIGYDGSLSSEFVLPMDRTPLGAQEYGDPGAVGVSEDKFLRDHASGDVSAEQYDGCVERTIAHLRQYLSRR